MAAMRVRHGFVRPFVITLASLPACGGPKPAPPAPPVVAAPDAAPASTPAQTPDAAPVATVEPSDLPPTIGYTNPPPPQPTATRDLKWQLVRRPGADATQCTAQQIEPCQRDKFPCKPPVENVLCVYESSSTPAAQRKTYPLQVEQKKGAEACYVVGTSPPEQTYCPTEWKVKK